MVGLTLADMLRLEAQAGIGSSNKAIVNIHLDGGPPQMDTIDMKPNAPTETRGIFQPISTSMPGFQVCELMPQIAAHADQLHSYVVWLVQKVVMMRFNACPDSQSKIWKASEAVPRWDVY